MEVQPLRRLRRLQNHTPITNMDPPRPLLRQRINTSGSFESTSISENPREPKLRYIQPNPMSVEIEYFQVEEFARNYNSPLIDLGDQVLV